MRSHRWRVALWKICFPLVGHAWCIFQLGDIFCGKWTYPFPLRCPDGCRIIFCCATFIFKIASGISTFSCKQVIPLITATNQYYLVLSLFVWAVLLYSRAFRKYSPNWLGLRSLFLLKIRKEAKSLNFVGASSLDSSWDIDKFPTSYPPQWHIPGITTLGRPWLAILSCHSFLGPIFFILAQVPRMQMKAEHFRNVEKGQGGVPNPTSHFSTYLFSACNSWGDTRMKQRRCQVNEKHTT